jgi:YVTN family beta-propeller protein
MVIPHVPTGGRTRKGTISKETAMRKRRNVWLEGVVLATAVAAIGVAGRWSGSMSPVANAQTNGPLPTHSSPIAITSDDAFVWSVNPDNNSVSVFNVAGDANVRLAQIRVGREPWCVAITPDNAKVYVSSMVGGTVSVINAASHKVVKTIRVGTEPFGCALTPDGARLYVTNQSSATVSVINTTADVLIRTIKDVGNKPYGIAITADGKKAT